LPQYYIMPHLAHCFAWMAHGIYTFRLDGLIGYADRAITKSWHRLYGYGHIPPHAWNYLL